MTAPKCANRTCYAIAEWRVEAIVGSETVQSVRAMQLCSTCAQTAFLGAESRRKMRMETLPVAQRATETGAEADQGTVLEGAG